MMAADMTMVIGKNRTTELRLCDVLWCWPILLTGQISTPHIHPHCVSTLVHNTHELRSSFSHSHPHTRLCLGNCVDYSFVFITSVVLSTVLYIKIHMYVLWLCTSSLYLSQCQHWVSSVHNLFSMLCLCSFLLSPTTVIIPSITRTGIVYIYMYILYTPYTQLSSSSVHTTFVICFCIL